MAYSIWSQVWSYEHLVRQFEIISCWLYIDMIFSIRSGRTVHYELHRHLPVAAAACAAGPSGALQSGLSSSWWFLPGSLLSIPPWILRPLLGSFLAPPKLRDKLKTSQDRPKIVQDRPPLPMTGRSRPLSSRRHYLDKCAIYNLVILLSYKLDCLKYIYHWQE